MASSRSIRQIIDIFEGVVEDTGVDYHLEIVHDRGFSWDVSLRLTPQPNVRQRPDRSIMFYTAAGFTPEEAVAKVVNDALLWLKESLPLFPPGTPLPRWNE